MRALPFLFSPAGSLRRQPFVLVAAAIYALGAAMQHFITLGIITRYGLWTVAASQALLVWIWYCAHAKRLRDAGRPSGVAMAVSLLYGLSIVLLLLIVAGFYWDVRTGDTSDAGATAALSLLFLLSMLAVSFGSPHYDLAWAIEITFLIMAIAPIALACGVTIWAATLPNARAIAA